jgi:hypothetical protein
MLPKLMLVGLTANPPESFDAANPSTAPNNRIKAATHESGIDPILYEFIMSSLMHAFTR